MNGIRNADLDEQYPNAKQLIFPWAEAIQSPMYTLKLSHKPVKTAPGQIYCTSKEKFEKSILLQKN